MISPPCYHLQNSGSFTNSSLILRIFSILGMRPSRANSGASAEGEKERTKQSSLARPPRPLFVCFLMSVAAEAEIEPQNQSGASSCSVHKYLHEDDEEYYEFRSDEGKVEVEAGVEIYYQLYGNGAEKLLMVMGLGGTHAIWLPNVCIHISIVQNTHR